MIGSWEMISAAKESAQLIVEKSCCDTQRKEKVILLFRLIVECLERLDSVS
jgi:hypothetical protein